MSRFVRASKYRHVFGQPAKKEFGLENVKLSNSAWDTNMIAASGKYISINWNASGGGAFAILPLPSPFSPQTQIPYKLPDQLPLARSHSAPVLDTDWSPHNDSIVASGGEDGKVLIWTVSGSEFDGWGAEGWEPRDFDPVLRIDASFRKIGQVMWHPTAGNVVACATGEHVVKLWDLARPEDARSVLSGHQDTIQSLSFNATGTLMATTCRDRKIRIFDPRAGGEAVRVGEGHGGIKGARLVWMGEMDRLATTGFSKMSDRQVGIWEAGSLNNLKTISIDQSAGVIMPFWTDNNILFLAGKGDGNIRYYEYETDTLHALSEHKSSDPQRGMCFLPRRALNVSDCEIARAYKVCANTIEPIAFIVPRKADSFQADIFPPAPSIEPSVTAAEFFSGKQPVLNLVALDSGVTFVSTATSASAPSFPTSTSTSSAPAPAPSSHPITPTINTPASAAPPQAVESPVMTSRQNSLASPAATAEPPSALRRSPSYSSYTSATFGGGRSPSTDSFAPTSTYSAPAPAPGAAPSASGGGGGQLEAEVAKLRDENAKLVEELRGEREKVRNLELALESAKANARRAAEALLGQ